MKANSKKPISQSWGLLFDQQDKERIIKDGETIITCRHFFTLPWDSRATDGSIWPEGGAVLMKLTNDEYLLAGNGVVVSFASEYEHQFLHEVALGEDGFILKGGQNEKKSTNNFSFNGKRIGIGFVDEVKIDQDGHIIYVRRHNGDQDHQGRHARISCGRWTILHIKLYNF
jgi:hypothetical protein